MKAIVVAAILVLLAACGSDTGEPPASNRCEKAKKSVPEQCHPGAPTPEHYGPVGK